MSASAGILDESEVLRLATLAQDFACGLKRPQNGSSLERSDIAATRLPDEAVYALSRAATGAGEVNARLMVLSGFGAKRHPATRLPDEAVHALSRAATGAGEVNVRFMVLSGLERSDKN